MTDLSNNSGKLCGVDCDVVSCKFHSKDNCCNAANIKVASKTAQVKAETYCSTYSTKTC